MVWEDRWARPSSPGDKKQDRAGTRKHQRDWNGYFKINAIDPTIILFENWDLNFRWSRLSGVLQWILLPGKLNPQDGAPPRHNPVRNRGIPRWNNPVMVNLFVIQGNCRCSKFSEEVRKRITAMVIGYLRLVEATPAVKYNTLPAALSPSTVLSVDVWIAPCYGKRVVPIRAIISNSLHLKSTIAMWMGRHPHCRLFWRWVGNHFILHRRFLFMKWE